MPNAANHTQLGQVTPSHAKWRVIFLMAASCRLLVISSAYLARIHQYHNLKKDS
jgi:hypothetical protein